MNNTTATPAMTAAATEKLRNGLFTCVSNMANMRRDADPTATEDEIFESIKASLIRMMSK
jgi:hypothetical protein